MMEIRSIDRIAATMALLTLSPLMAVIAVSIKLESPGPAIFKHNRVGLNGEDFYLYKFRSMKVLPGAEKGLFQAGDKSRITVVGQFLRKSKLDELPQLWNVVKGEMALVGPRPEVRRWVNTYPERWQRIHCIPPGITDPASIAYRHEESMLAAATNPEEKYRQEILPHKLLLYENYLQNRSLIGDLLIITRTIASLFVPAQ